MLTITALYAWYMAAEYGNTSAASIPLALNQAVRNGSIKKGDVVSDRLQLLSYHDLDCNAGKEAMQAPCNWRTHPGIK